MLFSHIPPKQSKNYFWDTSSEGLDSYYKNICILGDFNSTPSNPSLTMFLENQNLKNLIKNPTCVKYSNLSAIDLILTDNSYLDQLGQSFETEVSDHHNLICIILKSKYDRMPPKTIAYWSYKNFTEELPK